MHENEVLMWEAVADYEDGTHVDELFPYSDCQDENDQQYELECWLMDFHEGITWYSVDCIWI